MEMRGDFEENAAISLGRADLWHLSCPGCPRKQRQAKGQTNGYRKDKQMVMGRTNKWSSEGQTNGHRDDKEMVIGRTNNWFHEFEHTIVKPTSMDVQII
jgi:hypothetical protein